MARLEQHILIRTDLGMSNGLYAAQIAHIHAEAFRQQHIDPTHRGQIDEDWVKSPTIFVRGVPNPEILRMFMHKAEGHETRPLVHQWEDTIYSTISEGHVIPLEGVIVGGSIGPLDSDVAKAIGLLELPLYN